MMVHPLLGFPLPLHLVLEWIVRVCQVLLLDSTVSEFHVHTSNGQENTQYLNEDLNGVPVLFPLGLRWWCWRRTKFFSRVRNILAKVVVLHTLILT